jgi:hypothetical protein
MARTIAEIQNEIIAAKEADPTLGPALTSTSRVAIWLLWTYVVAVCQWTLESLYDAHKAEVAAIIATQKPHSAQWYAEMAKKFQLGDTLPADSDVYNPVSTDEDVLVVKHAATVENTNWLRIKVANEVGGVLVPLDADALPGDEVELPALRAYMQRVKDAGVRLVITSAVGDDLRLELEIHYDPLVLNAMGERIDGTAATPVKDAVNRYLRNLSFNGEFIVNRLIDEMELTEGVRIATVVSASANYAAVPYIPIPVKYVADAGYLVLDETYFEANITYIPYGV